MDCCLRYLSLYFYVFFFFKQKTAYERRISDWSSDVCSSDLLGGGVERGDSGEFGHAFIEILDSCVLFDGLWAEGESHQVWMSHGDKVTELAPGFRIVASSPGAPYAVIADDDRRYYAMQIGRASCWESVCQYV